MSVGHTNQTAFPGPLTVRLLDTVGNGTGIVNGNGNYSALPTLFFRQPARTQSLLVSRITVTISDSGGFDIAGYGSNPATLINGVIIQFRLKGVTSQSSVGPIKTNVRYLELSTQTETVDWNGAALSYRAIFEFSESNAKPFVINGATDDYIGVLLNDNFTFLTFHTFSIVGVFV